MELTIFTIKNFPVELHRLAKAAAAMRGMSLKDWVIEAMREKLARVEDTK